MRSLLKNLAALGIGILVSAGLLIFLEMALRFNRSKGWIDLSRFTSSSGGENSMRLEQNWAGVDKKFLREIPDHFRAIRSKYGNRTVSERTQPVYLPSPRGDGTYRLLKAAPEGETIFDSFFRFNEKQRRPTPGQPSNPSSAVFLVGCSYTLGEGLSENETVAAYMQASFKDTAVETLAFHGWGINNHLNALRGESPYRDRPNPYRELEGHPVIVVYLFFPEHIYRTTCPLLCYQTENRWMLDFPNYEVNAERDAKYLGSFSDSRRFSPLFGWIANSEIMAQFGQAWLNGGSPAMKRYFDVLNAYRKELGKRVPIKDFYFVPIEPYYPFDERIAAMARENGYNVLDLGKLALPEMLGKNPRIPFDGHFTPPVNYLFSRLISSRIRADHPDIQ